MYTPGHRPGGVSRRGVNAVFRHYETGQRDTMMTSAMLLVSKGLLRSPSDDPVSQTVFKLNINDKEKISGMPGFSTAKIMWRLDEIICEFFPMHTLQNYLTDVVSSLFADDGYIHMWTENGRNEVEHGGRTVFVDKATGLSYDPDTGDSVAGPVNIPFYSVPDQSDKLYSTHLRIAAAYEKIALTTSSSSPCKTKLFTFGGGPVENLTCAFFAGGCEVAELLRNSIDGIFPVQIAGKTYPLQTCGQTIDADLQYVCKLQNGKWGLVEKGAALEIYEGLVDKYM